MAETAALDRLIVFQGDRVAADSAVVAELAAAPAAIAP